MHAVQLAIAVLHFEQLAEHAAHAPEFIAYPSIQE